MGSNSEYLFKLFIKGGLIYLSDRVVSKVYNSFNLQYFIRNLSIFIHALDCILQRFCTQQDCNNVQCSTFQIKVFVMQYIPRGVVKAFSKGGRRPPPALQGGGSPKYATGGGSPPQILKVSSIDPSLYYVRAV